MFGVHHTDKNKTNYQRVRVNFTVPEGESTAKVSLKVAGGAGNSWANLDGVRIMKLNGITDQGEHYFYDDFENVDFGFGPFVSTESDNSHYQKIIIKEITETMEIGIMVEIIIQEMVMVNYLKLEELHQE